MNKQSIKKLVNLATCFAILSLCLPSIGIGQNLSGDMYFFNSGSGIVKFDTATRIVKPLGVSGSHLAISPNGMLLAYAGGVNLLNVYDLKSGSNYTFDRDRYSSEGTPAFISNNEITRIRDVRGTLGIYVTPINKSEWSQLPHNLPRRILGDTISVVQGTNSFVVGGRNNLYLVTADGTKQLFSDIDSIIRYPAVSPDGKKVVFVNDKGSSSIWIVGIDGSNPKNLINTDATSVSWSPDGRYIAYSSTNSAVRGNEYKKSHSDKTYRGFGAFTHRVWVMRSDGSDAHPLLTADGKELSLMYNIIWTSSK